ncbi:cytidylate kinase [bacterium BMS3Abin07]|nr:cytidylate kinase [bacterium BMS3Abin07]GBE33238.1 cytidylate kinase [bacterium BMS3Bbin05]HDO21691.1 (d)CMP kinase [Nitrospirota bacterium]HDZ87181.1 (d)CMP kinase [Nitrospirota bacterium]
MGKIIAIDGPSGSGKSSVSKKLAEMLGFTYLDTGAMYRAVALKLRQNKIAEDADDKIITDILRNTSLLFQDGKLFLDGVMVGDEIRTPEIGHYSSVFSARKVVRDFLFEIQRMAAEKNDIVAEGRDMTTVLFPDANGKFFLTASDRERARRRYLQLNEKGMDITMEDALRDVRERDDRDSHRDIAPLRKADDAILIDSTNLSEDETLKRIVEYIK